MKDVTSYTLSQSFLLVHHPGAGQLQDEIIWPFWYIPWFHGL